MVVAMRLFLMDDADREGLPRIIADAVGKDLIFQILQHLACAYRA